MSNDFDSERVKKVCQTLLLGNWGEGTAEESQMGVKGYIGDWIVLLEVETKKVWTQLYGH